MTAEYDIVRNIKSLILDTSKGATHAVQILEKGENELKGVAGIDDYIWVRSSAEFYPSSPLNASVQRDDGMGIMDMCGVLAKKPEVGDTKVDPAAEDSAHPGFEIKPVPDGNKTPVPNALTDPHLSAIQINHVQVHPANSRNTAGSIFFNSIPTTEMSQCSPFIKLSFTSDYEAAKGMTLFGFSQDPSSTSTIPWFEAGDINWDSFRVNRDYRDLGAEISGETTLSGLGKLTGEEDSVVNIESANSYGSGIELFQAPQVLNNLGNSGGDYNTQLNPAAPIASLQSLSIDITGLGLSALSNKTAALEIILHDRSAMRFLSPLIGASTFAGTGVTIEIGWMHPQATAASDGNVYANFLNSIRTKSDFNIQVAETSLMSDGQVRVGLKLASRGVSDLSIIPAGSGIDYIPASILSPFFTRLLKSITNKALEAKGDGTDQESNQLIDVNNGFSAIGSFKSASDLIEIKPYRDLLQLFKDSAEATKENQAAYSELIQNASIRIITKLLETKNEVDSNTRYATLAKGLRSKQSMLQYRDVFSDGENNNTPLTKQASEQAAASGDVATSPNALSENATNNTGSTMPTLGAVIMTYVGRPIQAVGKFDEVQIIFYPFNTLAAAMHNVNMAEFTLEGFDDFIGDIVASHPSISCKAFLEKLFSSKYPGGPANPAHPNYGLSDYYKSVKNDITADMSDEEKKSIIAGRGERKKDALEIVYDGTDKPCQFEIPDLSVYMESVPGQIKDGDKTVDTKILRVHIFDAKGGVKDSVALLQQVQSGPTLTIASEETPASDSAATEITKETAKAGLEEAVLEETLAKEAAGDATVAL